MLSGFKLLPEALDAREQAELLAEVLGAVKADAPFTRYRTPGGAAMSVAMSGLGAVVWTASPSGYRYVDRHPETGSPWPPIPESLNRIWRRTTGRDDAPDTCLVNWYGEGAKMGLHQDRDEQDMAAPIVSVSLGDTAIFRLGGRARRDPTSAFRLTSGDVMVLAGEARLAFHGVDRILFGSSRLAPGGGRINLTLRRAL